MRAVMWLMLAVAALDVPTDAHRRADSCKLIRDPSVRSPLFVLATAGADTVLGGPGTVEYVYFDSLGMETIHGQRFRLDRLGGDVPTELAAAWAAGTRNAVLVPHTSGCELATRWLESARWSAPGAQVVADVTLRPRRGWVDGMPTFDTDPELHAYPQGYGIGEEELATALTPAEVFELNGVLPTYEEVSRAPFAAYRPLLRWAAANPRLASRFPADDALVWAHRETLQPCVPAHDRHPAAGTYQLTVIVEGTDTLRTFARTQPRGDPMCRPARVRNDLTGITPRIADSTQLWFFGGANPASISPPPPRGPGAARQSVCRGSFLVLGGPAISAAGERRWKANLVALDLEGCFPDEPRFGGRDDAFTAYTSGGRSGPGTFRQEPGGVTFSQAWRVNGRPVLEVFATRIGPQSLGDP